MRLKLWIGLILIVAVGIWFLLVKPPLKQQAGQVFNIPTPSPTIQPISLQISEMRKKDYPGSVITLEQTLPAHPNYKQYIASYQSEGLKIYGLLDVPTTPKPQAGYPAIIFNHGYIPPEVYHTTERYVLYQDYFAKNGYVVFKPDFRGNGNSQGEPEGPYYSPAYITDALNALASVKKMPEVNGQKIGMWGHSMGGNIALKSLVVSPDIKAAVIWGGVVGTYDQILYHWTRTSSVPSSKETLTRSKLRQQIFDKYGSPSANPTFWNSVDPNSNLNLVQAPVQLHAGLLDDDVPWQFSQGLDERLKALGKTSEFYTYPGGDHNISEPNFSVAIQRSLQFFDKFLK